MDWPKTVSGWVGLAIAINAFVFGGGLAAFYKFATAPLNRKIHTNREKLEEKIDAITNPEHGIIALHRDRHRELVNRVEEKCQRDITGIGEKVDRNIKIIERLDTRVRTNEDELRDSKQDRQTIHRELGGLSSDVKSMRDEFDGMKVDIIGHIQRAKDEMLKRVDEVREDVGKLRTEVKVLDALQKESKRRSGEQE